MPPVEPSTEIQLIINEIKDVKTTVETNHSETKERFDYLEKRLFKGNGGPPWDVRLDRLEQFKKLACWIGCSLFSGILVVLIVHILIKQF